MGLADRPYMRPDYEERSREEQKEIRDWEKKRPKINREELRRLHDEIQRSKKAPEIVRPSKEEIVVPEESEIGDYGAYGRVEQMPGVLESEIFKSGELGVSPVSEEDFIVEAARDAGFEVENKITQEGYRLAKKGGYIVDLAGVGGFYRIWQGSINSIVRRESNAEDAIEWVNNRTDKRPVKGFILHY